MTPTDDRTPEARLLSKKRLGSFYLADVRALIERAEAAEAEVARLRDGLRERDGLLRWALNYIGIDWDESYPDEPPAVTEARALLAEDGAGRAGRKESYSERLSREGGMAASGKFAEHPAEDKWFIPEGDRRCGVVHTRAHATCMKRRGHGGPHGTPQGTWIDGPWCDYSSLAEDGAASQCGGAGHRCDNWPECSHVLATLERAEDGAA